MQLLSGTFPVNGEQMVSSPANGNRSVGHSSHSSVGTAWIWAPEFSERAVLVPLTPSQSLSQFHPNYSQGIIDPLLQESPQNSVNEFPRHRAEVTPCCTFVTRAALWAPCSGSAMFAAPPPHSLPQPEIKGAKFTMVITHGPNGKSMANDSRRETLNKIRAEQMTK